MFITRTIPGISGDRIAELGSKDGKTGLLSLSGPGKWDCTRYRVTTPEAIAAFEAAAKPDATDFGDEVNFEEWFFYVFTKRRDVQISV